MTAAPASSRSVPTAASPSGEQGESSERAVRCGKSRLSHAQIKDEAGRIASGLADLGVGPGDRVAIVIRNDIRYPTITLGANRLGAVPVPVNWHWKADEIRHVLHDSGSKVVFAHGDLTPLVESVLPASSTLIRVPLDDSTGASDGTTTLEDWLRSKPIWDGPASEPPTSMIYTSGTTGRPKGVLRDPVTPELAKERLRVVLDAFGLEPEMRTLIPAPLYHTAPHVHMLFAVQAGIDLTIMPRFDAEELLRLIEEHEINHIQAVPTMFVRLLALPDDVRARYDLSSLRAIVHAAAACSEDVKRQMIDWLGPILREYYGGTEVGVVVGCDTAEWLGHPGTVGRPVADTELRILGDAGDPLPAGEVGEIYIKPPTCQPDFRYNGLEEATAAAHRDGYVTLGDVGYLDEDGYLFVTDRASDMVISGGVNIYPAEIESTILSMPEVVDVAVFGVSDDEFGESLVSHVQLAPDAEATEADVQRHVRDRIAGYKVPRRVVFDSELPRDDSGKLVKRRLRDQYDLRKE